MARHKKAIKPQEGVFRFLELPFEIRLMVYNLVLVSLKHLEVALRSASLNGRLDAIRFRSSYGNTPEIDRPQLALLRVNKQITTEARLITYENMLRFHAANLFHTFIIRKPHFEQITRLYLPMSLTPVWKSLMGDLGRAPRLRKLYLAITPFPEGLGITSVVETIWKFIKEFVFARIIFQAGRGESAVGVELTLAGETNPFWRPCWRRSSSRYTGGGPPGPAERSWSQKECERSNEMLQEYIDIAEEAIGASRS